MKISLMILSLFTISLIQTSNDRELAVNFVNSLADKQVNYGSIVEGYLDLASTQSGQPGEALQTVVSIFEKLRGVIENAGHVEVHSYETVKGNPQLKSLVIPKGKDDCVYIVMDDEKNFLFPVLVEKGKIKGFSTFTKGDEKQYLLLW